MVPDAKVNKARECDGPAMKAKGVNSFSQARRTATFEVESAEYKFTGPTKAVKQLHLGFVRNHYGAAALSKNFPKSARNAFLASGFR